MKELSEAIIAAEGKVATITLTSGAGWYGNIIKVETSHKSLPDWNHNREPKMVVVENGGVRTYIDAAEIVAITYRCKQTEES